MQPPRGAHRELGERPGAGPVPAAREAGGVTPQPGSRSPRFEAPRPNVAKIVAQPFQGVWIQPRESHIHPTGSRLATAGATPGTEKLQKEAQNQAETNLKVSKKKNKKLPFGKINS